MSSVVISGNTSGTITLDAPAVAGTTTLTLPATSGTVVTKDTNGIASVNGIQFPATQSPSADANCLDDYEEGSWTPVLTFGGGSTGMTYSDQVGNYVKVGKWVTLSFNIALTAKGSSTGGAKITGIPFLNYTNLQLSSGMLIGERAMTSFNQTNAYFLIWNDGNIYLRFNGATGYIDFDSGYFNNTSCIFGVVTYQAAS